MKNWKFPPKNSDVAKYIECYWFLEKERGDVGNAHPKLNPDPSAHLIMSSCNQRFQYDQDSGVQKGNGSHWIFPHRKTLTIDHSSPFQIIGIKFIVGALYSLNSPFSHSKLELVECVDINQLVGLESFRSETLLINAERQPQQVCDTLDEIFAPWLSKSKEDKHSELVSQILPLLGNTSIAQMGAALHRSQRTIERSFMRVTDLTLKQCQSMIRLEEILNYLYQSNHEDIDWAGLAATFEFSDQSHLIRHLKCSIGKTPGEYARQRDLTIDIYGDFELI